MKLKTSPVTTSQPPQRIRAARRPSVRGALPRNTDPVTMSTNAAGISQAI
ncbi:Uncharacterised protein [Mycobacteroides abscessus subsp. abscessus]|nr:Uncharacterised protein [Mycobacteroides abscessus subsp. abscessus]